MSQADAAFTHERLVLAVREALAGCGPVSIGTVDCRLEGRIEMTNREMLDDLLRRLYEETLAIVDGENPCHVEARDILQFSVAGFSHAVEHLHAMEFETACGAVRPGVKCVITEDMRTMMSTIFKRLYEETLAIADDESTSHREARDALNLALQTMSYAAIN